METNERLKTALLHETATAILTLCEQLQPLGEGDLQQVEHTVMRACLAMGQRWLEEIVNHPRPENRPQARRAGECGHRQRLVGERPKQLLTLLGKVTVRRPYYQCLLPSEEAETETCSHGQAPFDALWGIAGGRTSPGVQQLVSYLGACMTLEEAATVFQRVLPLGMSARQVLNLLQPVGAALARQADEQVERIAEQAIQKQTTALQREEARPQEELERLYIEMDGVLARMRRGSVLMEAREQQQTGDVYREIKVGAVFAATRGPHRSHLAPATLVDQAGPIRYVAGRVTADTFGHSLYALAASCGVERAQQVVVLGDGARWIWNLAAEHFPHATQIVDIWHAREHVWNVAHAVFQRGSPQEAAWATGACTLLSEGHIADLVRAIEALPAVAPAPGATRSGPEIEAAYFRSNAQRMHYPTFRRQGMHIGSGIAEAACKTVVSTRAKRTGMRWTPDGVDAVLALRTAVLNETYDEFWKEQPHLVA